MSPFGDGTRKPNETSVEALPALVRQLGERLTALANYLAAARLVARTEGGTAEVTLAEILDKSAAEAVRAGDILRHMRRRLESGGSPERNPPASSDRNAPDR
jgi:hypothetical protein